jgi:DNA (cytosine-5)-methyltransferase 1
MRPRALDLFCCAGGATKGLQQAGFHVTGVDIKPQRHYCGDEFHQADALEFPLTYDCPECQGTGNFYRHDVDGDFVECGDCDEGQVPYDFIWASPPCQAFTALRFMPTAKAHPNLIPQTRAKLISSGVPYCIENVEGAPLGESGYLIMLCGTMFGLQTVDGRAELRRHRLFETSFSIALGPACRHNATSMTVCGHTPVDNRHRMAICASGTGSPLSGRRPRRAITVTGNTPQTNTVRNTTRETFTTQQAREAMGIDWMPMSALSQAIPPAYSRFIGEHAIQVSKPLALPAKAG